MAPGTQGSALPHNGMVTKSHVNEQHLALPAAAGTRNWGWRSPASLPRSRLPQKLAGLPGDQAWLPAGRAGPASYPGADRQRRACGSQALKKAAERWHRKTQAVPNAAPAASRAREETFAGWLPAPREETKTRQNRSLPAAPGQALSLAAPPAWRGLHGGAGGHPAGGEQVLAPRDGCSQAPGSRCLPQLTPEAGGQTRGQLPSRTGPTAAGRGHRSLAVALPSLRPRADRLASPSETFLI